MAKINAGTLHGDAETPLVALAASVCLLICMIVSLLGIKIWWFKHRLTFDHSQTKNGAAGGSAPAVPPRQRSSKDKRTEQYRTSVEVHGVFRKRQDDEFVNVTPANQLPPVPMNKLSQSTPALYPLPPTREPPRAPAQVAATVTATETTTITTANNVLHVDSGVQPTIATQFEYAQSPPQPPKRYNRNLSTEAAKLKIANELQNRQNMSQRRPTGFSMSADDLQALEYVKEPAPIEVQSTQQTQQQQQQQQAYASFEKVNVQSSFEAKANSRVEQEQQQVTEYKQTLPVDSWSAEGNSAWQSVDLADVESEYIYEEPITPTGSIKKTPLANNGNVQIVEVIEDPKVIGIMKETKNVEIVESVPVFEKPLITDIIVEPKNVEIIQVPSNVSFIEDPKRTQNVEIMQVPEPAEITKPSTNVTIVQEVKIVDVIEEPKIKNQIIIKPPKSMDIFEEPRVAVLETESDVMVLPPPRQVKFKYNDCVDPTIDDDKYTLRQIRRPTSFEGRNIELWQDLGLDEVSIKSPEERANQDVWLELQGELNNDLMNNIEEEFNKIRHSYQENEGAFLEAQDDQQPKGYGKSIDEDWASFENLEHVKQTTPTLQPRHMHVEELRIVDGDDFKQVRRVSFDLPAYEEPSVEDEYSAIKTRRPTGFINDADAMWRSELEESYHNEEAAKSELQTKVRFNVEENETNETDEYSPLKVRRPTGYTRNLEDIWDEKADMLDREVMGYKTTVHFDVEEQPTVYDYEEMHSPLKERRPTGYVPDYAYEETLLSNTPPEPLARKTKPRQKVTFDFNTEEHHYPAAYPTYNNSDYDDDDDDEEEYDGKPAELPKPMQRMTNIRYTEQSFEPIVSITSSPILFSTQVSLDESTASDASDSWSAIRQHRYMTEELQQFSLPAEAPKPAYRNPLAQMAMQMQQTEQRNPQTKQTNTFDVDAGYGTGRSTEA